MKSARLRGLLDAGVISDVSFPSLEALQACAASQEGKEALAHAASISTGGAPLVLVLRDE